MDKEFATFAGGCFWCTEAIFQKLKGVKSVVPGYCGGRLANPTYEDVVYRDSGDAESIQIEFDPSLITYEVLLDIFFHTHNPTTLNQQGVDKGTQYRSEIFYHSQTQKELAEQSIKKFQSDFTDPIVTQISQFKVFYPAEDYHKNFYKDRKNVMYCSFVITPKLNKLIKEYSQYIN